MDKLTLDERIPLAWAHETEDEPTRFYTQAGNEMQLTPGRTYVALLRAEN